MMLNGPMIKEIFSSKRILIQGSSGSGKSTLAEQLGKILNLPVIYLDKEYWMPGWQKPNSDEWHQKQIDLINQERWIMEGGAFIDAGIEHALAVKDTIRPDIPESCVDKFDFDFAKWILMDQPQSAGPLALKTIQETITHSNFLHLRNPGDTQKFLNILVNHK